MLFTNKLTSSSSMLLPHLNETMKQMKYINLYNSLKIMIRDAGKGKLLNVILWTLAFSIFEMAGVAVISPFLELFLGGDYKSSIFSRIFGDVTEHDLKLFATIFVVSMLFLSALIRTLGFYKITEFAQMRRHEYSHSLLSTYLLMPYKKFVREDQNKITKNILSEVDLAVGNIFQPLMFLIAHACIIIFIGLYVLSVSFVMTLLIFSIIITIYVISFKITSPHISKNAVVRNSSNEARFEKVANALNNWKRIKLSSKETETLTDFEVSSTAYSKSIAMNFILSQTPKYIVELVAFTLVVTGLYFANKSGNNSQDIIAIMATYVIAGYKLLPSVQAVFMSVNQLKFGFGSFNSLLKSINDPENRQDDSTLENSESIKSIKSIEFKFKTLNKVDKNVRLKTGESLIITGASGSGKSTLLDHLMLLRSDDHFLLKVNEKNIDNYTKSSYQKNIEYIPQDVYLNNKSIYFNIFEEYSDSKLDCIFSLLSKYGCSFSRENILNRNVGNRGSLLSGGERQRVMIVRSILNDSQIIIMDESTSGLDELTEEIVMTDILNKVKNKILIIISHNPKINKYMSKELNI